MDQHMEEVEAKVLQMQRAVEGKGESLTVQLSRVLVVNLTAFLAGKLVERAFDKVIISRTIKPLAEIKTIHD